MRRNRQKTKHMGFWLLVKLAGEKTFQKVATLFDSRYQAERHYRGTYARRPGEEIPYRIQGSRIGVEPVSTRGAVEGETNAVH